MGGTLPSRQLSPDGSAFFAMESETRKRQFLMNLPRRASADSLILLGAAEECGIATAAAASQGECRSASTDALSFSQELLDGFDGEEATAEYSKSRETGTASVILPLPTAAAAACETEVVGDRSICSVASGSTTATDAVDSGILVTSEDEGPTTVELQHDAVATSQRLKGSSHHKHGSLVEQKSSDSGFYSPFERQSESDTIILSTSPQLIPEPSMSPATDATAVKAVVVDPSSRVNLPTLSPPFSTSGTFVAQQQQSSISSVNIDSVTAATAASTSNSNAAVIVDGAIIKKQHNSVNSEPMTSSPDISRRGVTLRKGMSKSGADIFPSKLKRMSYTGTLSPSSSPAAAAAQVTPSPVSSHSREAVSSINDVIIVTKQLQLDYESDGEDVVDSPFIPLSSSARCSSSNSAVSVNYGVVNQAHSTNNALQRLPSLELCTADVTLQAVTMETKPAPATRRESFAGHKSKSLNCEESGSGSANTLVDMSHCKLSSSTSHSLNMDTSVTSPSPVKMSRNSSSITTTTAAAVTSASEQILTPPAAAASSHSKAASDNATTVPVLRPSLQDRAWHRELADEYSQAPASPRRTELSGTSKAVSAATARSNTSSANNRHSSYMVVSSSTASNKVPAPSAGATDGAVDVKSRDTACHQPQQPQQVTATSFIRSKRVPTSGGSRVHERIAIADTTNYCPSNRENTTDIVSSAPVTAAAAGSDEMMIKGQGQQRVSDGEDGESSGMPPSVSSLRRLYDYSKVKVEAVDSSSSSSSNSVPAAKLASLLTNGSKQLQTTTKLRDYRSNRASYI